MDEQHLIEDIKWFMFGDSERPLKNEMGEVLPFTFESWTGEQNSFLIRSEDNREVYRVIVKHEYSQRRYS